MHQDLDDNAINNFTEYYAQFRDLLQTNLERAAGASAAYLIRRAPQLVCKTRGAQCGGAQGSCCGSNATCSNGLCIETQKFQLLSNGSTCSTQTDCASGFCHKASCTSNSNCSGTCTAGTCSTGTCSDPASPGSPNNSCVTSQDCAYGSCVSNTCSLGNAGANCRDASDCADGMGCVVGCCGCMPVVN